MASKIQRTIDRSRQRVEEGQYYEAHQQLRVIASRHVKTSDWSSAVDLLSSGATMLMKAGQGGSGGDLCRFLMEVYNKAELPVDSTNKGRLLSLLRAFPANEPTKKRFVADMIGWSAKYGEFPAGDPDLHHVAGSLCAEEGDTLDAERHLVLGTSDSADVLANMEYEWYTSDEPSTAPLYAARSILPYLLVGNLRAANKVMLLFTSKLAASPGLGVQHVSSSSSDLRVYPSLPLLDFLQLLLLAIQRGSAYLFRQLKAQYAAGIRDMGTWDEPLAQIGEMYFGIKIPSQSNPLMDMMGSFLMGGGSSGGSSGQARLGSNRIDGSSPAPPPALD